jgi:hypothetical protein
MANIFLDLDLGGAPSDASALGKTKTVNATGSFSGQLVLEANCGGEWGEVLRFNKAGNQTIDAALKELRVNASGINGTVTQVTVSAADTGAKFVELPADGTPVDVSALGTFKTVIVIGSINGQLKVQISDDGVAWTDWQAFPNSTVESAEVVTQFMHVDYSGAGVPDVCVGAINESSDAAAPITAYVFRPEATGPDAAGQNVYTDWEELYAALQSTKGQGPRELWFDARFSTVTVVTGPACVIPEGTWDMKDVAWRSEGKDGLNALETTITFEDFAFCPNLEIIEIFGNILHDGELHSPLSSAFRAGLSGSCEFLNTSPTAKPIVLLPSGSANGVAFFLNDGCQLGGTTQQPGGGPLYYTPAVNQAPMIDFADNFVFVIGLGVNMVDNVFAGTNFALMACTNAGFSGGHSFQFPALNAFDVIPLCNGGVYPRFLGSRTADFDVWQNRVYHVDTSAGPITATLFDSFGINGAMVTIIDATGDCGENNLEVVAATSDIQEPYLNRPFQSKTWIANRGTWKLKSESHDDFVTDVISAATDAINNATNLVDSSGGAFNLTLPLAATAKKGSIIRIASDGSGGANAVTAMASGGDTIVGAATVSDLEFKSYQSDGGTKWIRIA